VATTINMDYLRLITREKFIVIILLNDDLLHISTGIINNKIYYSTSNGRKSLMWICDIE
jgi:hypothetical protein